MGTYTSNYNLFMPTVGETGWGTLVNTNFSTIDTTMKSLSNRITAVENEVNGALSCTSVTTSGKVTGNGGIAGTTGTFSGAVTGASFNGVVLKSSGTVTVTPTNAIVGYLPPKSEYAALTLLPPHPHGLLYTGSMKFVSATNSNASMGYFNGSKNTIDYISSNNSSTITTLSFTNIPYLVGIGTAGQMKFYGFKMS